MKVLIIGKSGQVGSNLVQKFIDQNHQFLATDRTQLDLNSPNKIKQNLESLNFKPQIIINAAAYTAVDKAEDDRESADNINHKSVAALASYCAENNIFLIHYSTDYVFDGKGESDFLEGDTSRLEPQNFYGKTKLLGEQAIQSSICNYLILRTSWVYNHTGSNFVLTMLKLMQERESLKIINDQIGSPTYAADIADATINLLEKLDSQKEIVHFCPSQQMSWYQFALKIKQVAANNGYNLAVKDISPISTSDYPTKATRPLNSRLNVEKLNNLFGIKLPTIDESLDICFQTMK